MEIYSGCVGNASKLNHQPRCAPFPRARSGLHGAGAADAYAAATRFKSAHDGPMLT